MVFEDAWSHLASPKSAYNKSSITKTIKKLENHPKLVGWFNTLETNCLFKMINLVQDMALYSSSGNISSSIISLSSVIPLYDSIVLLRNSIFTSWLFLYKYIFLRIKKTSKYYLLVLLAGAVGFEPTTNGFGDHYSTVEPYPFETSLII